MKAAWILIFSGVLLWSGFAPKDRLVWFLEVLPALIGAAVLAITAGRCRLTPLVYFLILVHAVILMIGGRYTYAEVPFFATLGEWFGWTRNNYDKLGHFAQGFVPAMIAREIVIRLQVIPRPAWRNFFIICFCLAVSAFYELIEWWVAVLSDTAAETFLATQGYEWDTQSDMLWALIGAIAALLLLARLHDRQLRRFIG